MPDRRLILCTALAAALAFPAAASAQLPTEPIDDVIGELPLLGDPADPVEDIVAPIDPGDLIEDVVADPVPPPASGTTTTDVVVQITAPAPSTNPHGALRIVGRRATLSGRRLRFRVACTASSQGCTGKAGGRAVRLGSGGVRRVELGLKPRRARAVRRSGRARVLLVHAGHTPRLTTVRVRR